MKKRTFKFKKIISLVLSIVLLFGTISFNTYASESSGKQASDKIYKIYNGYGEIIYTADSLDEVEAYLSGIGEESSTRSTRDLWKIAKTFIKQVMPLILGGLTIYKVKGVMAGESTIKDVIELYFPVSDLEEALKSGNAIYVYSTSGVVINPYPPHSYQGTQWYRTNFYCVVVVE